MKRIKTKSFVLFLVALLILSTTPLPIGAIMPGPSSSPIGFAPDEILVKFKPSAGNSEKASTHKANNATFLDEISKIRVQRVKIPSSQSLQATIDRYKKNPLVEYAEPNYVRSILAVPNDQFYSSQWAPPKINAEQAWDITTGEANTTIAVLDTGVDYNHEDLAGKVVNGYDFHNDDTDSIDDHGHGTMVAGVAAAVTNNNKGIAGISWGSKILAVKVMGADGLGYSYRIAYGIIYAADQGADVINLSLGGSSVSSTEKDAVNYARSKGSLVVAAVGNDGNSTVYYPAAFEGVIGVGATDKNDNRASYSNYGSFVDVVAPGDQIRTASLGNTYVTVSGTSLSTPHVSGLIALIASKYPSLSTDEIETRIQSTVVDLGAAGRDDYYGYGRIDAGNALSASSIYYQDPSNSIVYAGSWTTKTYTQASGGSFKGSNTTGSTATLTFSGIGVTWVAIKAWNRGIAKVYIDGVLDATVDLYDPNLLWQQAVYSKSGLAEGAHSIKVEVSGSKNASATDYWVDIDVLRVDTTNTLLPAAPVGVTASAQSRAIAVSWTANSERDLFGYKVYFGTAPGVYGTPVDVGNTTSYTLTELTNSTTYYIAVTAYDTSRNESLKSLEVNATPVEDGAPAVPTGLKAKPAYFLLELSWNPNSEPDIAGYRIYYGTTGGVYGAPIDVGNVTSYRLTGLTGGMTYYLVIAAYDLAGSESLKSAEISTVPMDARYEETSSKIVYTDTWNNVTDSRASGGSYRWTYVLGHWPSAELTFTGTAVAWISKKGPDSGIGRVYVDGIQKADVDLYSNVPLFQQNVFAKTGLAPGTHTIKVVEIGVKSAPSSDYLVSLDAFDVLTYTDTTPPAAPTGLSATPGNGSVSLSWNANTESDLAGYNLYRSTTTGGPYTKVNSSLLSGTSYTDSGLTNGTAYYYVLTAVDTSSNESAKSTEVSATPVALTRYEETNSAISYSGTWASKSYSSASGGGFKGSNSTGATATLTFNGTSVTWIAIKAWNRGMAKVYLDGTLDATIDLYNKDLLWQQAVYTKSGLASGSHTLKIEVSGTKNASATDYWVDIDAFDVT